MAGQETVTYSQVKVFNFPNATFRVYIPDLTEEERAKRMREVQRASAELMKSVIRDKKKKEGEGIENIYS